MKVMFKIIALFMVFLISENLFAQQVHISNIVKQQREVKYHFKSNHYCQYECKSSRKQQ